MILLIDGIMDIGRKLAGKSVDDFLKSKIIAENREFLIKVNFDTIKEVIQIIPEKYTQKDAEEHYWVGNNKGTKPQTRLTTSNLSYLLTQSIGNLYDCIEDGDLKRIIANILQKFGTEIKIGKNKKRIIDIAFLENIDKPKIQGWKNLDFSKRENKNQLKQLLDNYISEFLAIPKKQMNKILYTAYYNNRKLADFPEYKNFLYSEFLGDSFKDTHQGTCHACNKVGEVTKDFTKFELKFFINQKISFASELDREGFLKNYTLCKDCFNAFSAGERFVKDHLSTKLARTTCYIIPEFYDPTLMSIPGSGLKKLAEIYVKSVEALDRNEKWMEYRKELSDLLNTDSFALNFVFVEVSNNAVKIKKMIQEIPPSRFLKLFRVRNNIAEKFEKVFKQTEVEKLIIDFTKIFYLFPVRKDQTKNILEIYDALLSGKKIKETSLIKDFMEIVRMHKFDNYQPYYHSHAKNPDIAIVEHLVLSNEFLVMLQDLEIIEEGGGVVNINEIENLDEDLANYIKMMNFDNQKAGLFLFGVIIASIASEQYKIDQKKPILDKLNYQGMPLLKVKSLANELFDKMRQYKVLNFYTEQIYSLAKQLFDMEEKSWKTTPQENVYYILSGYAYKTKKTIEGGMKNESRSDS